MTAQGAEGGNWERLSSAAPTEKTNLNATKKPRGKLAKGKSPPGSQKHKTLHIHWVRYFFYGASFSLSVATIFQ